MSGPLQALLIDMDGTIVDTEQHWMAAEYALVNEHGGRWSDEHAHALIGSSLDRTGRYLRDVGGVRLEPDAIVARLIDDVVAATTDEVPWRPGAAELLAQAREAGVPCALVTMSYRKLALSVVDALPPGTFTAVVAGDEVRHGKPDPEAYLTACERLGVSPGRCVALEDSPTGVAAAMAAGCVTVGIPHHVPIEAAPGLTRLDTLAGVTLADLEALLPG